MLLRSTLTLTLIRSLIRLREEDFDENPTRLVRPEAHKLCGARFRYAKNHFSPIRETKRAVSQAAVHLRVASSRSQTAVGDGCQTVFPISKDRVLVDGSIETPTADVPAAEMCSSWGMLSQLMFPRIF